MDDRDQASGSGEARADGSVCRVGMVGTGTIARAGHWPAYLHTGQIVVSGVVDVDRGRAQQLADDIAARTGATPPRVYGTLRDLLANETVDGVSLATPNASHADLAVEALMHGVDVLVEKPMATRPVDADRIVAAEAQSGRHVLVGMTHRYRQDVEALKRFIDAGQLGRIYHAEARLVMARAVPRGWFRDRRLAGGGALWDTGVHVLDLAWYLMGRPTPTAISGHLESAIPRDDVDFTAVWTGAMAVTASDDVEDFAAAWVRFENGATLALEVTWAANFASDPGIRLEILGTEGGASLVPLRLYGTAHRVLTETVLDIAPGDAMGREMTHFAEVMRGERPPRSGAADGRVVVRMLDAMRRASEEGREVRYEA